MVLQLPSNLAASGLTIRRSDPGDARFLRALYATARTDAMLLATLPAPHRDAFLDDQFRFQDIHYRRYFGGADFLVMEQHGTPIGRLILDQTNADWQIVDIALIPALRGQGIGRALLQSILDAAVRARAASVILQVEAGNRARALYARLGFVETGDSGLHVTMVWTVVS
jgi:ribosomal protein S18 acetylase RimI-like enzyme